MTTDGRAATAPAKTGYVFGGLSFIPGLGVIFGVVAIIIGVTKRDNKVAFLGIGGIALSVVLYSALFYFGFVATFGPYAALKIRLTEQMMRNDAGQIALYKLRHGRLPTTLAEVPTGRDTGFIASDPWFKPLAYKANADGTFELRSAGPDGKFDTPDDIVQTY